jgi:chorismate lyase
MASAWCAFAPPGVDGHPDSGPVNETDGWAETPPAAMASGLGDAMMACLLEPVSLTDRLIGSNRPFSVEVLFLGQLPPHADEQSQLVPPSPDNILARHVALNLSDTTVVVARSYCRWGCPVWTPVLDRGSRSLGFTLFSGEVAVQLGPLEFRPVAAGHPLFDLARQRDPVPGVFPARRRRFVLDGAAMVVCEVFLPRLEASMGKPKGQ